MVGQESAEKCTKHKKDHRQAFQEMIVSRDLFCPVTWGNLEREWEWMENLHQHIIKTIIRNKQERGITHKQHWHWETGRTKAKCFSFNKLIRKQIILIKAG